MTKRMRKVAGMILAMVLMVISAMPAMAAVGNAQAAEPADATITIQNPTMDATYKLYKVFDATVSDDGKTIAYSIPKDQVEGFNGEGYFAADSEGNITVKEAAHETTDKNRLTAGAIEWIKKHGTLVGGERKATETEQNDDKALVFKNLTYGYYYVTSSVKDNGAITVTSIKPNATIIDKNQGPGWTPDPDDPTNNNGKKIVVVGENGTETLVDTNSMSYGEQATFRISIDATNYNGENQIETYYIVDKLQNGFTLDGTTDGISSVKVYERNKDGNGAEQLGEELANLTDSLKNSFKIDTLEADAEGKIYQKFVLTIPWAKKDTNDKWISNYGANTRIVVEYKATLNEKAVIAEDGNLNKATFSYKYTTDGDNFDPENPDPSQKSTEEITTTYTYALAIKKVKEFGGAALSDAHFTITDSKGAALSLKEFQADEKGNRVYYYTSLQEEAKATELVSPDNGIIIVRGVKEGSYTLTETKAPAGYNKLTASETITASLEKITTYTKTIITYLDADKKVTGTEVQGGETISNETLESVVPVVIKNTAGVLLPSTGGMGTTLFYLVGGILVIGAAVLLITKKRMGSKD